MNLVSNSTLCTVLYSVHCMDLVSNSMCSLCTVHCMDMVSMCTLCTVHCMDLVSMCTLCTVHCMDLVSTVCEHCVLYTVWIW